MAAGGDRDHLVGDHTLETRWALAAISTRFTIRAGLSGRSWGSGRATAGVVALADSAGLSGLAFFGYGGAGVHDLHPGVVGEHLEAVHLQTQLIVDVRDLVVQHGHVDQAAQQRDHADARRHIRYETCHCVRFS